MTCTCKAELAAMLLEVLEVGRAASYGVDRERFDHAKPFRDMKDAVLRRLSPAPAEPQEPSPRYEVWLGTRGWIVGRYYGDDISWLDRESGRFLANTSKPRSEWASFPTESAARAALLAALLAASEPGKAECVTGLQHACPKCGKPSNTPPGNACSVCANSPTPAPFDAAKPYSHSGPWIFGPTCGSGIYGGGHSEAEAWAKNMNNAYTAAHEAGKAEVLAHMKEVADRLAPAPPAEKEGPR